ncbi:hypothetical protein EOD39_2592 [Acipenser ruthenus]|uniref:Uncharacterized protein n=1 Tax=Acipenser ruthenus TaxID=7906 RepID=A0A444TZW4_ACIRT|nr:hypothetical protein EOD39_2592 [Acipenser ruthenus]
MANNQGIKDCPLFTRLHKSANARKTKEPSQGLGESSQTAASAAIEAAPVATPAPNSVELLPEILAELKSLSSRFDTKFDVFDGCLNAIVSSVTTQENSLTEIVQRINVLGTRIETAAGRIAGLETAIPANDLLLNSLKNKMAQLEEKVDDIENRGISKNAACLA